MRNSSKQESDLRRRSFLRAGTLAGAAGGAALLAGCASKASSVLSNAGGMGSSAGGDSGEGGAGGMASSDGAVPAQTVPLVAATENGSEVWEMTCDQIPNHSTGLYPNASDPCPILPVKGTWRFPRNPEKDPKKIAQLVPTPTISAENTGGVFGMAINGVRFHTNAPFWKTRPDLGWQFEQTGHDVGMYFGLDHNNAHTHPIDGYHYHAIPWGLIDLLVKEKSSSGSCAPMLLMGWAADGYPVYAPFVDSGYYLGKSGKGRAEIRSSYRLKAGQRPQPSADDSDQPGGIYDGTFAQDYEYVEGLGDLDECNGRFGKTPEFPEGIYHYFVTRDFPSIPRFWRGTPNPSFIMAPPEGEPVMLLPLMGPSINWQPASQTDLLGNRANSALFQEQAMPAKTSTRASLQTLTVDGYCYAFMVSSIDSKVYMSARSEGGADWSPWLLLPGQDYPALESSQPVSLDLSKGTLYVTQTVELPVSAGPGPYPYEPPYGIANHRIQTLSGVLQAGKWVHRGSALDTEP